MAEFKLTTPVAFFVFNRPETTAKVFASIREASPQKLYLVADGPRKDHATDDARCQHVREIIKQVDWDCTVYQNFSDENLGCRQRVSSGLNWVFDNVEEAIILEDDCLPDPSFYRFCSEMLETYRNDKRIVHIGGDNFLPTHLQTRNSYYFSYFNHIWGWASWKRAWAHYDVKMQQWEKLRESDWLQKRFANVRYANYWKIFFDQVSSGSVDTWDCQWTFACWVQDGLSIIPGVNLISNIGFAGDATHTSDPNYRYANLPVQPMEFPLHDPTQMERNRAADIYTQEELFSPGLQNRIIRKLKNIWTK